ncbi:hypothetical protein GCM10009809_16610 [Isoptericola hypogeus]|uniref:MOSC domain-containing protein n=1 Tax=Isoptericola hypogeus TaxID=300179 RepID=A0ABP4VBL3_9MICO
MRLLRRPQLGDEHRVRLVVADADLVEQAARVCQLRAVLREVRDKLVTPAGGRAERADVRVGNAVTLAGTGDTAQIPECDGWRPCSACRSWNAGRRGEVLVAPGEVIAVRAIRA